MVQENNNLVIQNICGTGSTGFRGLIRPLSRFYLCLLDFHQHNKETHQCFESHFFSAQSKQSRLTTFIQRCLDQDPNRLYPGSHRGLSLFGTCQPSLEIKQIKQCAKSMRLHLCNVASIMQGSIIHSSGLIRGTPKSALFCAASIPDR